jgi:predicted ribosomally synthesized peptide with SipW-like signal peptide
MGPTAHYTFDRTERLRRKTMTVAKTMRTKLVLGILAAAVSLSLAIGGTLMLFTADSETATNTVTLGEAKIALQEATAVKDSYTDSDYGTVGVDIKDEINFKPNAVPGDTFALVPRVQNTGSIPVYVKVKGNLTVTPPKENLSELSAMLKGYSYEEYAAVFGEYFDKVVLGYGDGNWSDAPIAVTPNNDGTVTVSCTWYYAEGGAVGSYGALKELDAAKDGDISATEPIFKSIVLPKEMPNAFRNFGFSFDLVAYAVQSENNPQTGNDLAALEAVFGNR